jgi:two-component system LytT family response regulator
MNCLIVDEEKSFRTSIKRLLSLDNSLALVDECGSATDALEKIKGYHIDLIFWEIRMPGISGLELAGILEGRLPMIIFTSTLSEYALEAFDLNAVDYLLKPIIPARFF